MSKRGIYIFLIIPLLIFSCKKKEQPKPEVEVLTGKWERIADFPAPYRQGAFTFTIGSKAYLLGGRIDTLLLKELWEYDPSANKWARKADYPGNGALFAEFDINNKGYIYSGTIVDTTIIHTMKSSHEFYEYDAPADKWTKKADFPGDIREEPLAFSINGAAFMGLGLETNNGIGFAGVHAINDFWRYDQSADSWTRVADYPGESYRAVGFACNNKGYVGLGYIGNTFSNDFWEYDPNLNSWDEKARSYNGNKNGGFFVIGSKAYAGIGGNNDDPHYVNNVLTYTISHNIMEYNTLTDQWVKKADYPGAERSDLRCFSINNTGYAGFGFTDGPESTTFYKFTP